MTSEHGVSELGLEPVVRHIRDVAPVPCPCGESTRPLTSRDTPVLNLHVTHIRDSARHYHKRTTEAYYILEGEGFMELGDETIRLEPGLVVYIPTGVAHRGHGDFRAVIVGVPAMPNDDEFFLTEDNR
jgi:mannose-6-phosphate isomerase-like protein (cupin superfamily)